MNTDDVLKFKYAGKTFTHNERRWRSIKKHPTTGGFSWGWIEGPTSEPTWSNDPGSRFTSTDAGKVVRIHNQWIEDQKPPAVKLAELDPKRRKIASDIRRIEAGLAEKVVELETIDAEIAAVVERMTP